MINCKIIKNSKTYFITNDITHTTMQYVNVGIEQHLATILLNSTTTDKSIQKELAFLFDLHTGQL